MAEVLLLHHAQGQTAGFRAFEELRQAGHTVHTPDLFDGRTFASIEQGAAYVEESGFDSFVDRGVAAAADLPAGLVYAGISLGVLPAQKLAQTRSGARGALLLEACVPLTEFGDTWPEGLPVQVRDGRRPLLRRRGDMDAARDLVQEAPASAELFVYPGDRHLFTDSSLESYDAGAASLLMGRVLAFLGRLPR